MSLSASEFTQGTQLTSRGVGDLISATFGLFRRGLLKFVSITALVMLPYLLVSSIQSITSLINVTSSSTPQPVVGVIGGCFGLIAVIISVFLPWMSGATTYAALERVMGRAPGARDSYRAVRSKFASLWASNFIVLGVQALLSIPLVAGIYGGLFAIALNWHLIPNLSQNFDQVSLQNVLTITAACCLPLGLVLLPISMLLGLNWSMSTPVIVGEGLGVMAALRRSTSIVKGHRLALLGRFIAMGLLLDIIFGVPLVLFGLLGLIPSLLSPTMQTPLAMLTAVGFVVTLVSAFTSLFHAPLGLIYIVLNYLDLRVRKDNLVIAAAPGSGAGSQSTLGYPAGGHQASAQQPTYASATSGQYQPVAQLPPGAQTEITKDMTAAQRIGVLFNLMRVHGASAALLGQLGSAYQEVGDLGAALDSFGRAREADPRNADLAFNIMRLHLQRKDQPSARAAMADYLRLETDEGDLKNVMANPVYRDILPPAA